MRRLTYKIAPEVVNYDAEDGTNFQDILNTLGAYEDTGLTPEEIIQMNDFSQSQCAKLLAENSRLRPQLAENAADVAKVVRCKDCVKRYTPDCAMWYKCSVCGGQWSWETDNDFCSIGRKIVEVD